MYALAELIELRYAMFIGNYRLGIDDRGVNLYRLYAIDNPGIALGPVHPGHGVKPDAIAALVDLKPVAIVFDFVNPQPTGRGLIGFHRLGGINERRGRKAGSLARGKRTPRNPCPEYRWG